MVGVVRLRTREGAREDRLLKAGVDACGEVGQPLARELPPRESASRHVSTESRYGICGLFSYTPQSRRRKDGAEVTVEHGGTGNRGGKQMQIPVG